MKRSIALLFTALFPALSPAQEGCFVPSTSTAEECQLSESQESCQERLNALKTPNPAQDAADQAAIQEKAAEAEQARLDLPTLLALANSGDSSNSSINDFVPLLRLLLDGEGLGDDGQKMGVELSDPFGFGEKFQNKISLSLQKPEVFAPIKEAMQAASLIDELSTLEDNVDARDDISVSLSFGYVSQRYGRDPRMQRDWLEQVLSSADLRDPEPSAALNALAKFERDNSLESNETIPFCQRPKRLQAENLRLATRSILAERDSHSRFSTRLRKAGFYDVLDLIGNQPQLSFTATYRSRDEAAGPNEFNAAFSYEEGMKNVNDLRRQCGQIDIGCLADFLATDAQKIRAARRLRFNAEYTRIERLAFVLPAPGFSYLAEPAERLAASLTLGGYRPGTVQTIGAPGSTCRQPMKTSTTIRCARIAGSLPNADLPADAGLLPVARSDLRQQARVSRRSGRRTQRARRIHVQDRRRTVTRSGPFLENGECPHYSAVKRSFENTARGASPQSTWPAAPARCTFSTLIAQAPTSMGGTMRPLSTR